MDSESVIATGKFSVIYKGYYKDNNCMVAVKKCNKDASNIVKEIFVEEACESYVITKLLCKNLFLNTLRYAS